MFYEPSTGNLFQSLTEFRQAYPHTSFGDLLTENERNAVGLFSVSDAIKPSFNRCSQKLVPGNIVFDSGSYVRQWAIEDLSQSDADASMARTKSEKNAEINAARLAANRSTFEHQGKVFACDELSRSDIDGVTSYVSLSGSMPPGWPGAWKAVDNTYHPITSVDDWKAFVASMVAAGNANFAKAQALKVRLASATTSDQIEAIRW